MPRAEASSAYGPSPYSLRIVAINSRVPTRYAPARDVYRQVLALASMSPLWVVLILFDPSANTSMYTPTDSAHRLRQPRIRFLRGTVQASGQHGIETFDR